MGDILFSRVARSNLWGLLKLGAKVTFAGPSTLLPGQFQKIGASISYNLENAVKEADAIMLLRIQHERQQASHFPSLAEYSRIFGLNSAIEQKMKKDTIILHPGPLNRGAEIDSKLADSKRSVILDQVANGIFVRDGNPLQFYEIRKQTVEILNKYTLEEDIYVGSLTLR